MVLTLLGGSLVLGTGLLAAASFSDGALVAFRTAAQLIGWLFVCAILLGSYARASRGEGWRGLRRAGFGEISAATITFLSGIAVLYVSYFEWGEIPHTRHAAAEVLAARAGLQVDRQPAASRHSGERAIHRCRRQEGCPGALAR